MSPTRRAIAAGVKQAAAARGPIDILVANAGGGESAPVRARPTPRQFRRMFELNVMGVVHATRAVLAGMVARGFGRIVAIASIAGLKGYPYVSAYCTAKHAVVGLVRALAQRDREDRRHRQCGLPRLHRHRPGARRASTP